MINKEITAETIRYRVRDLMNQPFASVDVIQEPISRPATKFDNYFDYVYADAVDQAPLSFTNFGIDIRRPEIIRFTEYNFTELAFCVFKYIMEFEGRFISVSHYNYSTDMCREKTTLQKIFNDIKGCKRGFVTGVIPIDVDTSFGFKIGITLLKNIIKSETWYEYRVSSFFEGQSFVS